MKGGSCSDGKHPSLPAWKLWVRVNKGEKNEGSKLRRGKERRYSSKYVVKLVQNHNFMIQMHSCNFIY